MTTQKERLREAMAQFHSRSNAPGLANAAFDCAGYACCFFVLVYASRHSGRSRMLLR